MRKIFKYFAFVFTFPIWISLGYCQLSVNGSAPFNSSPYLVQNILLGTGVVASNITYVGDQKQIGYFDGQSSNLGLDSGIVMSSDDILENTPGGFGTGITGVGVDNDLLNIANSVPPLIGQFFSVSSINDKCVLEFDFVPSDDTVEFRYVFGSDEYLTYVNTSYNDVFAFLISGPGIAGPYQAPAGFPGGAKNIAIVPNSSPALPITISSVNNVKNSQYYINNPSNTTVGLNGFTSVFTAMSPVTPCQTYHIKLAIADGSDGALISSVFLEAKSFSSGTVTISATPPNVLSGTTGGADTALYESCGPVIISLVRVGDISIKDTVILTQTGNAIEGVDYTNISDTIIFMPGDTTATFSFDPIQDFVVEGLDTLNISIDQTNICFSGNAGSLSLSISDIPPLQLILLDDTANCLTPNLPVTVSASSGIPPLHFLWSTSPNDTDSTITVSPLIDTDYYVTVTDGCGLNSSVDTVKISVVNDTLSFSMEDDTVNCLANAQLDISILSGYEPATYLWSTGQTTPTIIVNPQVTTDYFVTVTDACGLDADSGKVTVSVFNDSLSLITVDDTVDCINNNTLISVQVVSGIFPVTYLWSTGQTTPSILVTPPVTTNYLVTVTDACGSDSEIAAVSVLVLGADIQIFSSGASTVCPGDTALLEANPADGFEPYVVWWDTNGVIIFDSLLTANPLQTVTYTAYATDQCGKDTGSVDVTITVADYTPLVADAGPDDTLDCPGDVIIVKPSAKFGSGGYTFTWNNWIDTKDSLVVNPLSTTFYVLGVTDHCPTDTVYDTLNVVIPVYPPLTVSTNDTLLNSCPNNQVNLLASASGGEGTYFYSWSNFAGNSDSVSVFPPSSGNYTVYVSDKCGNSDSANVSVSIVVPEADFEFLFRADNSVLFTNTSLRADSFLWNFGEGGTSESENPVFYYKQVSEHDVKLVATTQFGCSDSIIKKILPPLEIWVPNSITPNGDDINDVFLIKGTGVEKFSIVIFDRWGEIVYQSDNIFNAWDGKSDKGRLLKTGAYVYHIKASGLNFEKFDKFGTVTLIR